MQFDSRTTELIALGASVAANCQSCVEYHFGKATDYGVPREEIAAAIDVGRMVRRGAAGKIDKIAAGLLEKAAEPAAVGSAEGCGCGA